MLVPNIPGVAEDGRVERFGFVGVEPDRMNRTALVTGVSRRQGIGFAIARRLLADGARVFAQS